MKWGLFQQKTINQVNPLNQVNQGRDKFSMKICLINNLYKPFHRGGAERVIEIIAEGLKKEGHDVFVISSKPAQNILFSQNEKEISDQKIKIYHIKSQYFHLSRIPLFLRLFWHVWDEFDFISANKVRQIVKEEKPDVVMTHNLKGLSFLTPLFLGSLKTKKIHVLHDIQLLHPSGLMFFGAESLLASFPARFYQAVNKKLFNNFDLIISPSEWLMKEHESRKFFYNSKKLILPNPVNDDVLTRVKDKFKNENFIFLYIGHLSEAKGTPLLLKAFTKLLVQNPNKKIDLILAGSNLMSKDQKKLLDTPNVKVLGFVGREKIEELLKKADCLVVPSLCYENSPTVMYEAASFGLPMIVSQIGGAEELCLALGGILFMPGNAEDLFLKMKSTVDDIENLDRIGSTELSAIKQYSTKAYLKKLVQDILA